MFFLWYFTSLNKQYVCSILYFCKLQTGSFQSAISVRLNFSLKFSESFEKMCGYIIDNLNTHQIHLSNF